MRSRNLWLVMLYHALIDFASLMGTGIWGMGTSIDGINQISVQNLVAVPVLLIPCIVLLRPRKLAELEQQANGITISDTWEEAQTNALMSFVLGMISILLGASGYGIGIALTGILGATLSRNYQTQKNPIAFAGLLTSTIGLVFGLTIVVSIFQIM